MQHYTWHFFAFSDRIESKQEETNTWRKKKTKQEQVDKITGKILMNMLAIYMSKWFYPIIKQILTEMLRFHKR